MMLPPAKLLSLTFLLVAAVSAGSAFRPQVAPPAVQYRPGLDYTRFVAAAADLQRTAAAHDRGELPADSLRAAVAAARLAYKRVEFAVAYAYPAFAKTALNAAPLPRVERSGQESSVEPPRGLQVLDELAFAADEIPGPLALGLADRLLTDAAALTEAIASWRPEPAVLAEAAQEAVVRITTLGLTGFDTPGSLAGVAEAEAVARRLGEVFAAERELPGADDLSADFARAADALGGGDDFDDFDRLAFQREHADPLYRRLGELIGAVGGPNDDERRARRPLAAGLYAADFLDPLAYARLSPADTSAALRTLGERLFADPALSAAGDLSCASCHRPELAYADGEVTSLPQQPGDPRRRNAPTLLGAALSERFFYDLRAFTLEQQAEHVIFDADEFGTDYTAIVARLGSDSSYPGQFARALPRHPQPLSREGIGRALAAFVVSLEANETPFDRYARGLTDDLPADVRAGYNLFMGRAACGTCHFAPTFSGLVPPRYRENESEVLGVPADPAADSLRLDPDLGRAAGPVHHERTAHYRHAFKTTTVRNAARTAPYFHNGSYPTLVAVLDFYNRGGGEGLGLEVPNQTLAADPLGLSEEELHQLEAFLVALSSD